MPRRTSTTWYPRATWGMTLGLFISLVLLLVLRPGFFGSLSTSLEYDTLDYWFALRDARKSDKIAIVSVDSRTLHRWNERVFDGAEIAQTLRNLKSAGVKAVALNFPTLCDPTAKLSGERELIAAVRDTKFAVLPIEYWLRTEKRGQVPPARVAAAKKFASKRQIGQVLKPLKGPSGIIDWQFCGAPVPLMQSAAGAGYINFDFDRFGRIRNLPLYKSYNGLFYPSMSVATARAAGHTMPPFEELELLNYPYSRNLDVGYPPPFTSVSLSTALDSPKLLGQLKGKVVVMGITANGIGSRFPTPTGVRITTTELQAVALDNLFSGEPLRRAPEIWHWIFTILPGIIVGGFAASRRPSWSGPVACLCVVAVTIASFGLFSQNLWLDTSVPWLSIALTFLVGVMGRARRQERDSTHIASTINALTRVSDIIAAQTRQWDLLDRVLSFATQALGASGASALLLDGDHVLTIAAAIGPNANDTLGVHMAMGEGIAGHVAQSGEAVMTNEASEHPYFSPRLDGYSEDHQGITTRNLICVPLKVRDRILGVIKVVNRENNLPFSDADVELLGAVANQAAVALDNARLYDRLAQRVEQSQGALAIANRQLQADKNLLQTVLLSMTDGIVVTDRAGRIQLVNPAAQTLVPELGRNVLGEPLSVILEDFSLANLHNYPRNEYAEEVVSLFRGDLDSPRHIEARAAPLQTPDGEFAGLVAVFADVTQRRQIEQAKSDFVSFVAHEMRSPLTSISGFSAMLQRAESSPNGGSLPANSKTRFLGLIRQESERLTRLINSLLDVAKLEAGKTIELNRDEVDFAQIANFCIDSQRAYSSRHTLVAAYNSRLPLIDADADKVTQVLINLISNALKYSPGGKVMIGATVQGQWLEVSVKDDGPGILPKQKEVLFSRFGRTSTQATGTGARSKPTGTGLGLFLTKHFVEKHGGQIWVDSEPGHGATFFFTLPLAVKKND